MYVITFRSVTYAQRAEQLLKKAGFRCYLQRTPAWMEQQGCGYSLQLAGGNVRQAVTLLEGSALPMRRVYVQNGAGELEELRL